MKEIKYWASIEEKNQEASIVNTSEEALEGLPVAQSITDAISVKPTGRRDFLKTLGFTLGAATLAASCTIRERKSIPYLFKPEGLTPGIPNYYATAYTKGGDYAAVLVKTLEGRPILVEPNKKTPVSNGAISSRVVSSVLELYYGGRYQYPLCHEKEITWKDADADIKQRLENIVAQGKKIVLFSSTIISPSTKAIFDEFIAKYPTSTHVVYDAISYGGIIEANEKMFGRAVIPQYSFDKADLIVGIGADFLGQWISGDSYAVDYAKRRKVSEGDTNMSRHIQIESLMSLTGSNADKRVVVSPVEEELAVIRLYNLLGGKAKDDSSFIGKGIEGVAKELKAAKAKGLTSLVVSGSNNLNVQMVVNAINQLLGNYGKTLSFDKVNYTKQGKDKEIVHLLADMQAGNVGALFFMDANPIYALPFAPAFKKAMEKVSLTVSLEERKNETSVLCEYVCPANHYLESWNDAHPCEGTMATTQPTIAPLFNTRQPQESLLRWMGKENISYYDYIRDYWKKHVLPKQKRYKSFNVLWENALHDGEIEVNVEKVDSGSPDLSQVAKAAQTVVVSAKGRGTYQLKLYESVIGNGSHTENPWLLELPDPITRITWDNYILASYDWVKENGLLPNLKNKAYKQITLSTPQGQLTLPVVPQPGLAKGTFGIALGWGREKAFHKELERGGNAYPLVKDAKYIISDIQIKKGVAEEPKLAIVQVKSQLTTPTLNGDKTRLIVKEASLDEYKENPAANNIINGYPRKEWIEKHLKSLYGTHDKPGHHWGLVVDLNTCTGCAACVVSCNAENNVPVVGQVETRRAHEMHWLRIDRYYSGEEAENPSVVFQPMMCQHCDNAPCENVCPVSATNNSSEGLNQMIYNRCIGTRYCANNCPYKVRRFNWFDYQGADSFEKGTLFDNDFDGQYSVFSPHKEPLGLHTDLARMVLNPNVTVRGRGVMEKCSFCVQRIQQGKLEAKKAHRPLKDGDVVTACQAACSSGAITFGDLNDPNSEVLKAHQNPRAYGVIEEIHTLPSVQYLTKIRNTEPIV